MTNLVQKALKEYRDRHKLSYLALAQRVNITSGQLKALETGTRHPSLSTLQSLAGFFKWSKAAIGEYVIDCKPERAGPKRFRETIS